MCAAAGDTHGRPIIRSCPRESELKAKGVSHIAVCVADLEKSLEFYRDILGLTVKLHTT